VLEILLQNKIIVDQFDKFPIKIAKSMGQLNELLSTLNIKNLKFGKEANIFILIFQMLKYELKLKTII
jgi:hypothetical protein